MPYLEHEGAQIYYEVTGEQGPAVLLIAPGGMKSAISFWSSTPWNPIEQLADRFTVVAMDQRNAGASTAPVSADHGWHTYADDQLALMDHLGFDEFHVVGMCIGGPYSFGLIQAAPNRIKSATLFQTIGRDDNRDVFYAMFDGWAEELKDKIPAAPETWSSFRENMYGGDKTFFNVDEDFVSNCTTPLLVLMGDDVYHPQSSSRRIAQLSPNVTFLEQWKGGDDRTAAMQTFENFLTEHA